MKAPKDIRSYIKAEPAHIQTALKKLYAILKKAAPRSGEKLAWGMPTLTLEGNLVHFAAFKNHMSLFPGTEAITHFKKDLKTYVTSKATIQFPYGEKLPTPLITRIIKYNIKQNLADAKIRAVKKKSKKKK